MIVFNIKQARKLPGLDNIFVSFTEPLPELIEIVRSLPNRVYDSKERLWEVPMCEFKNLLYSFRDNEIEIHFNNKETYVSSIPSNYAFKTNPFDHQRVGIEYGLNHDCWLLGDEMGLGKTKLIIDLACIRKLRGEVSHCLIICGVNMLKYNWGVEIEKHSNESYYVLGTRFRKNGNSYMGTTQDKIDDIKNRKEFFLITNGETLVSDEFTEALKARKDIEMYVVDECHKMNNHTCKRGKNLQSASTAKYKIAATGTPILNTPLDAYGILKWLGVEKSSYSVFKSFYCAYGGFGGHSVSGYKNLNVLRKSMEHSMLRRLKKDVLNLPDKIYQVEYLEMSDKQREIYQEAVKWTLENIDLIVANPNPLSQMIRLRQATGYTGILSSTVKESCKFERIDDMVASITASGGKVIIYSNWTSITDPLAERLKDYQPAIITGRVPADVRMKEAQRFQNDTNCKVCIGIIEAMGAGLTLTAANTVIFCDLPWTRGAKEQAEDRVHRIGATGTVNVVYLCCKDTIDEKVYHIVESKGAMADMLVDGVKVKWSRQDLLNLIE